MTAASEPPTRIHGHHAARFALVMLALLPAVATLAVLLLDQVGRLVDQAEFAPIMLLIDLALAAGIALGALGFVRRRASFALGGAAVFAAASIPLFVTGGALAGSATLLAAALLVVLALMPTSRGARAPAVVPRHSP